jgi:hypothetical protein
MWYEDRGKTYANEYYLLKIKEHTALHDVKQFNRGIASTVTGSHHQSDPFIVDWQMQENGISIKYESPPVH